MAHNPSFVNNVLPYASEESIKASRLKGQEERARVPKNYLLTYYKGLNPHLKTIDESWLEEFNQWRVSYRQPDIEDPTDFELEELSNNQ